MDTELDPVQEALLLGKVLQLKSTVSTGVNFYVSPWNFHGVNFRYTPCIWSKVLKQQFWVNDKLMLTMKQNGYHLYQGSPKLIFTTIKC